MDIKNASDLKEVMKESVRIFSELKGVTEDDLTGPCRKRELSLYRQMIWMQMYLHSGYTTTVIGDLFNRTHATVLYGVKKMKSIIRTPGWQEENELYNRYCSMLWVKEE